MRHLYFYGSVLNGNQSTFGLRFDCIPKITCYSDK